VLLIENDINTAPFTPAVYECVPPQPWSVSEADLADHYRCGGGVFCRVLGLGAGKPRGAWDVDAPGVTSPRHLDTCPTASQTPRPSEDLRHLPVCSVDPPGCKDIDDALHVR
jgi:exosome complex exonuclease DIS3/RRP44